MHELEIRYLTAQGFTHVLQNPTPHGARPRMLPEHAEDSRFVSASGIEYHPALAARDGQGSERAAAVHALRRCHIGASEFQPGEDLYAASIERQELYLPRWLGAVVTLPGREGRTRPVGTFGLGQWIGVQALHRWWQQNHAPATRMPHASELAEPEIRVLQPLPTDMPSMTADCFSWSMLAEGLARHQPLRRWLENQVAMATVLHDPVKAMLAAHPQLRGLSSADLERVLQLGMVVRQNTTPDPDGPYQRAGLPRDRVALIISGEARAYLSDELGRRRLVGRFSEGDILGAEELVSDADMDTIRRVRGRLVDQRGALEIDPEPIAVHTEVHLSPGTVLVEFSWFVMRWSLVTRIDTVLPAVLYRDVDHSEIAPVPTRVSLFAGSRPGLGTTAITLGAAYDLAEARRLARQRKQEPARLRQRIEPPREVWVIDLDGEGGFERRYAPSGCTVGEADVGGLAGLQPPPYAPAPHASSAWSPGEQRVAASSRYREVVPPGVHDSGDRRTSPSLLDRVRVIWPLENHDVFMLIALLKARPEAREVVVRVPDIAPGDTGLDLRRVLIERLAEPGLYLGWVDDDPEVSFPASWPVPDRYTRIDRVNRHYVERARKMAGQVVSDWRAPSAEWRADGRYTPAQYTVRVLEDGEGGSLASMLDYGELWRRGATSGLSKAMPRLRLGTAIRRLGRTVRGEVVGLALGGGGVWGAAHIALLSELTESAVEGVEPMPIDLITGTSFGALVGGMYCAGGLEALDAFIGAESIDRRGLRGVIAGMRKSEMFKSTTYKAWRSSAPLAAMVDNHLEDFCTDGEPWGLPALPPLLLCTEIPFYPVTTALGGKQSHTPRNGTVGWGVRAAGSLPPLIPGMRRHSDEILDGAFVANVPAEVARERGGDFVISSNVVGPLDSTFSWLLARSWRAAAVYDASPMGRLGQWFRAYVLTQWQVGQDQGRLAANVRLDMFCPGVSIIAGWRMRDVRDLLAERMTEHDIGAAVRSLFSHRELWDDSYYARLGRVGDEEAIPADVVGAAIRARSEQRRRRIG